MWRVLSEIDWRARASRVAAWRYNIHPLYSNCTSVSCIALSDGLLPARDTRGARRESRLQNKYMERLPGALWRPMGQSALGRRRRALPGAARPTVVQRFWARARLPPWDRLEANMRSGPPPFLRPGWKSPLQGTHADLRWLTEDAFECVKGSLDGWRDKKVLLIEFWASWCRPCLTAFRDLSNISATRPDIKIITFNVEGIFTKAPIDVATVRAVRARATRHGVPGVYRRQPRRRSRCVRALRTRVPMLTFNADVAIFEPGQTLSIPLVFIITPKDGLIHWVGNPEEMAAPLAQALASA
ncbi:hypothetical protein A0H81_07842 [Grifola frondosa]|uniref:Thioredoxin domain-containing protein n=1 Tax=Grifola frondosa TaxID=5627 RepID=A0A1C7M6G4_GRIFR|nr:hypothetical protein A0H81_07842 [Grifola frondosa]